MLDTSLISVDFLGLKDILIKVASMNYCNDPSNDLNIYQKGCWEFDKCSESFLIADTFGIGSSTNRCKYRFVIVYTTRSIL